MQNHSLNFEISNSAQARLKEIIADSSKKLRITINSGGCSGFEYCYSLVEDIDDNDIVITTDNNVDVVIDDLSSKFLHKAKLDYITNLVGSYFQIINPNANLKCGCGNSFSV